MDVTYFRTRRPGPEALLESVVARRALDLFPGGDCLRWTAGSVPVGAGLPDLVIVDSKPKIIALSKIEASNAQLLAYLRAVGRARLDTIVSRIRLPRTTVARYLDDLADVEVVTAMEKDIFSLTPDWREILPEVISIEVKMRDWMDAVRQAARNSIFAHKSFVALPRSLAGRVCLDPLFKSHGIGLLSVDADDVQIVRPARRRKPRVWTYYYQIAFLMAKNLEGYANAVRCSNRGCAS